jgi:hypothetical protein
MRCVRIATALAAALTLHGLSAARADSPPAGYTGPTLASAQTSEFLFISQLAFNPNDPLHLYAARYEGGAASGFITRYDYSAAAGLVTNPVTIATVPGASLGLAFFNNDLYVSTSDPTTNLGGIIRYQATGGGTFGNPVEFINNIPVGVHQVDHLQVGGNSLYVGIGTKTDQGINNTQGIQESVYNGTIGRVADLTRADYSAAGADNLALANVLTDTDPGKLHVFASGFRNPFGLRVTGSGQVWATDNGQDNPVTPDLLYKGLVQGDKGVFQTNNPGNPVSPLANLGPHTAATGFDIVPLGSDQGNVLLGLFHFDTTNPAPPLGNEVVLVNGTTGAIAPSLTSITSATDVLDAPDGRILIADYGPNFDNGFNPSSGGIFVLTPAAVPEPPAGLLLAGALAVMGGAALARRRAAWPGAGA